MIRPIVNTQDGRSKEVTVTPLDEGVRKAWIEIQKQHDVPVNAIGVEIDPKDINTLQVWRKAGIERFVRR